jgi:hypothetical protein
MKLSSKNVCTKQLGHLGLVASTIRDLGLIEKIDVRITLDKSKGEDYIPREASCRYGVKWSWIYQQSVIHVANVFS